MNQWKEKLTSLMDGLNMSSEDKEKFINRGDVEDFKILGQMFHDDINAKNERIAQLGGMIDFKASLLDMFADVCDVGKK